MLAGPLTRGALAAPPKSLLSAQSRWQFQLHRDGREDLDVVCGDRRGIEASRHLATTITNHLLGTQVEKGTSTDQAKAAAAAVRAILHYTPNQRLSYLIHQKLCVVCHPISYGSSQQDERNAMVGDVRAAQLSLSKNPDRMSYVVFRTLGINDGHPGDHPQSHVMFNCL